VDKNVLLKVGHFIPDINVLIISILINKLPLGILNVFYFFGKIMKFSEQ
jgi:hypothetical protein